MGDDDSTIRDSAWTEQQGDGYPALADFIAQDADHETYVFRRFKKLAVRNILQLQGDISNLETKVEALEREAAASNDLEVHLSMKCWAIRDENAHTSGRDLERRQQELNKDLDVKLKKYYETLVLYREIAQLESPSRRILTALRDWLHGPSRKPNSRSKLDGREKAIFDVESDLVALRPPPDRDFLSRLLRDHWPFPSEPFPQDEWDNFRHFKDRRLSTFVTALSVVIASLLLTCPIIVLYFVTHPDTRLALVIIFILVFALGLSVSTSANRDAIFAATAAYSAVLVVFVSGDLANASQQQ